MRLAHPRVLTLGSLLFGAALLSASCASVRTTGPKTSVDRCVDRCDEDAKWCQHPTYQTGCGLEYDSCILRCEPRGRM